MSNARILITGSQEFGRTSDDATLMYNALIQTGNLLRAQGADTITVVHGDARGADKLSDTLASNLGYNVERHPADWNLHGKRAGMIRNEQMVDLGADVVLAFPVGESRGTRHCMTAAQRAYLPVVDVTGGKLDFFLKRQYAELERNTHSQSPQQQQQFGF